MRICLRVLRYAALGVSVVLLAVTAHALTRSGEASEVMLTSPAVSGNIVVESSGLTLGCHRNAISVPWSFHTLTHERGSFIDELEGLTPEYVAALSADGGLLWRIPGAGVLGYPNGGGYGYMFYFRHSCVAVFCSLIPCWCLLRWCLRRWLNRGQTPATAT